MTSGMLDESRELTHRRLTPPACRRAGASGRRGGRADRLEPAFARSKCSQHGRRVIDVGELQVRSGVRPFAEDACVGGVIKRDPLDGVTGATTVSDPYPYAQNDPLDRTDPLGRRAQKTDPRVRQLTGHENVRSICTEIGPSCIDTLIDYLSSLRPNGRVPDLRVLLVTHMMSIFSELESSGICGSAAVAGIVLAEGSGCLVDNAQELDSVLTVGLGVGVLGVSATAGAWASNAHNVSDISGDGVCFGNGAGEEFVIAAEVCFSIKSNKITDVSSLWNLFDTDTYSGLGSLYLGAGVGVGSPFAPELLFTTTAVSTVWDYPDVLGPIIGPPIWPHPKK